MMASANVLRRFLVGFEGTRVPRDLGARLRGGLAGVAIYRRNWETVAGLRALTDAIRAAAGREVLNGMDQEGGTPFSLPEPFTQWPSPAALGGLNDEAAVEEVAHAVALELRAAGCNLNFAPLLDLHVNPASPVTTGRSYGGDPQLVARLGTACLRGLHSGGVLGCAKHFPGHGDATLDPHTDLPVFHGDAARLETMELVPFSAAIAAEVPAIMTAHILLPGIDSKQPASLSRALLQDTLRMKMGFRGVILADDLGMGAIRQRYGAGHAAIAAFQAGADVVMLCHDWALVAPALEAVQRVYESHNFDEIEWRAAHLRIETLLQRCRGGSSDPPALDVIGCAQHRALADQLFARINAL
jgi:beta-N-acetylhexosaminidase